MTQKLYIALLSLLFFTCSLNAQNNSAFPKGNLFIIGGGDRTDDLVKALLQTADLSAKDYIAVLPMSSAEPDSSYFYIKSDLEKWCGNYIAFLNFKREQTSDRSKLDSVRNAKLIFITGGDQSRFMNVVLNTPLYDVIHEAYNNGSTISGTSAGAAVMSKYMITGNQLRGDTVYHSTFDRLWDKNIEFQEGLGLLDSVIVDQHFIVRSRYNRMISALAAFPAFTCAGIDESTAIVVHQHTIKVVGESQVIMMKAPENLRTDNKGLIKFSDVKVSIYTSGDSFKLQ